MGAMDIGADGDPYLDRLKLIKTPLFSVYLHHIHRQDIETDPHDHPWDMFFSIPICGSYVERHWPDKHDPERCRIRHRRRWSIARTSRRAAHMIDAVTGPLWTVVFIFGRDHDGWGFWRDGAYIPFEEYEYAQPERSGRWRQKTS
jgi:hypothetical protein